MKVSYRLFVVTAMLALLCPVSVLAYPMYNGSPSCDDCHPGFIGGFSGPLHQAHLLVITDCLLCHVAVGDNPPLSKCAGCHVEAGVVAHHDNAGAPPDGNGLFCVTCHPGLMPGPESTAPPYYALASVLVKDPCLGAPAPGEDFTGDGQGLDNDGDLAYDEQDPDCALPVEDTTWGKIKALYTE
jgi:hypothetical protein